MGHQNEVLYFHTGSIDNRNKHVLSPFCVLQVINIKFYFHFSVP